MKPIKLTLAVGAVLALNGTVLASPTVELGGVVEIEATRSEESSDIAVAKAELGVFSQINEKVTAEVLLQHEAGKEDPIVIDIATVTLGFTDSFSLTAGQTYAPFGVFDKHTISSPLTKKLAETGATLIQADLVTGPITSSLYTFNGSNATDEEIDNWGATVSYTAAQLALALGYIGNLGDSDGIAAESIDSEVPGISLSVNINAGTFTLIAEHVRAEKEFQPGDGNTDYTLAESAQPSASYLELAHSTDTTTIAMGIQRSDEAEAFGLPERRAIAAIAYDFMANTTLTLEYVRDEDYTGEDKDTVTAQLAVEF